MTIPSSSRNSPEDGLWFWQFMTVSWMTPLIQIGSQRELEDEDVWALPLEFQHARLHERFRVTEGTVIERLIKAHRVDIGILMILGVLESLMQFSTPLLLQRLLASMRDPNAPKNDAILYAALSLAVRLIAAQSGVFSLWYGRRCYEQSRGEMITMLFEKTLSRKMASAPTDNGTSQTTDGHDRLPTCHEISETEVTNGHSPAPSMPWHKRLWSQRPRWLNCDPLPRDVVQQPRQRPADLGKILNIMRSDVYEVAQRFWEVPKLVQKPLSIVLSVSLVVRFLGLPSLLAVLALVLAQTINILLARVKVHFERKRRKATDIKLQAISQFVEAIRHLRWYGWHATWLSKILAARENELNLRIITSLWNICITFVNTLGLDLTPVIAFFALTVIAGRPLTIDIAFPALQLFNTMTFALRELPQLIEVLINARVASGRINDFMAEPDLGQAEDAASTDDNFALKDASLSWPGAARPVLKKITLRLPTGLTVIHGKVGSGKTAILQALLGELDLIDGHISRPNEPIAYCAQQPWLQSMSIRENIIFGSEYEENKYKNTLEACALSTDLASFQAGDLSLIGENGIGLSGGQCARIALARAVYSTADILLLDDPLSALDQQTAETIVKNLLAPSNEFGFRTQSKVVLVTHRVDLVAGLANQVVEVRDGMAVGGSTQLSPVEPSQDKTLATEPHGNEDRSDQSPAPIKFMEDEHRARGGVKLSVYWEFVKAGTLLSWGVLVVVLAVYRSVAIFEAWYLKTWGEAYAREPMNLSTTLSQNVIVTKWSPLDALPAPEINIKPWLVGMLVIGLCKSVFYVISQGTLVLITYTAAKTMFKAIMEKISGATFRFYDVTPVGRLMNRMTSDIGVIDGNISIRLQSMAWLVISWIGAVAVIGSVTPLFLLFTVLLTLTFILIFKRFIPTSQSLRRLEMISLTPLMSNFGALLHGLSTVRAFRVQQQFMNRVISVVDTFQKMDHFYWSLQAWLMYRYDTLSAISTFLITMLALQTNVSPGLTAFVLVAADRLVAATHLLCKDYGQLQMEFVSVERVVELMHLEQEPKGLTLPPAWWPSYSPDVVFENVTIRYAPHLQPALSEVSFTIKGGSKTAIVGRTGSGKSTLALALLATIVPESGTITIDKFNIIAVDRQILRTKLTFLAQDPVLFPGTMHQNLDPLGEHTPEACAAVLSKVCSRQKWTLDTLIEGGGHNLSQGQRQLVGLARAVIRRSAVVILDEATASIDKETSAQIQGILQREMIRSTIITIAHRIEAVSNADYCIVLGNGRVLDQGEAKTVLNRRFVEFDDEDSENTALDTANGDV